MPYPSLPSVKNLLLLWSVRLAIRTFGKLSRTGEAIRYLVAEYFVIVSSLNSVEIGLCDLCVLLCESYSGDAVF